MCRIVEEIVEKEVADTKRNAAVNMLKSTKLSPEEISRILNMDKESVEKLSKQLTQNRQRYC